jgi:hypothetical protein
MKINIRKSANKKNKNIRKSIKNFKKVGGVLPKYLYLIYTEAPCALGNYLFHIRYLSLNLKDALQYYHSFFTKYLKLSQGHKSFLKEYLNYATGLSSIGKYYLDAEKRENWLQHPSISYSNIDKLYVWSHDEEVRNSAVKHLVDSNLNEYAYDSYCPFLVKLDISSGEITRDIFYKKEDTVFDDRISSENQLSVLVNKNGDIPQSTLNLIEEMHIAPTTLVSLHFLKELGLYTSSHRPVDETVGTTKAIVNKRYPSAKELDAMRFTEISLDMASTFSNIITDDDFILLVPSVGLDISNYNIVLSEGYFEIKRSEEPKSMFSRLLDVRPAHDIKVLELRPSSVLELDPPAQTAEEYNAQHPDNPNAYD